MKKIAVVICAYNEEERLPACLTALTHQDFPKDDYYILVVDNNSTDKTVEIAKGFGAEVVKEERQGNTFALAKGLSSANAEIIASTDADTIPSSNWLSTINQAFSDETVAGITGAISSNSKNKVLNTLSEGFYKSFLTFSFLIGKPNFSGFNFAIRKSVLDKMGGVDEQFTMSPDVDLGLRAKKYGKVLFIKDMKVQTSIRRWEKNPVGTFWDYTMSYFWSAWLRKPPRVKQKAVR